MHIQIDRDTLLSVASRAAMFAARKTTIPILSNALFEVTGDQEATITATDLERQIKETFECNAIKHGSVTLPIVTVMDVAKKLPKTAVIEIKAENGKAQIRCKDYVTNISTEPAEDFPATNTSSEASSSFSVSAHVLRDCFNRVSFAMSSEETRYYLNGVFVHSDGGVVKMVATDGHRLARTVVPGIKVKGDISGGFIIPKATVNAVSRFLDADSEIHIDVSSSGISFNIGASVVTSKLVDGKFPEYDRVIPRYTDASVVRISSRDLSDIVERVAVVSNEKTRPVRVEVSGDTLSLSCSDSRGNTSKDNAACSLSGAGVVIGFQARYLSDVAGVVSGDSILHIIDSTAPAVMLDSANEDVLFVLMPIRL